MKFSTKITLLFSSISIFFFIILSYISYLSNSAIFEAAITEDMTNYAFQAMDKLDRLLYEKLSDIKQFSRDPILITRGSTQRQIDERLRQYISDEKSYSSISYFDSNRVRIADTSGIDVGVKHPFNEYWPKLFEGVDEIVSFDMSASLNKYVIHFASKVKDANGKPFSTVVSRVPIEIIVEIIKSMSFRTELEKDIQVDIMNDEGLILFSNYNPKSILKETSSYFTLTKELISLSKNTGSIRFYPNGDKEEKIIAIARELGYKDYKGNGWIMVISIPYEKAFAKVKQLKNKMLGISAGIGIFIIFLTYLFSFTVTKPIKKISYGLQEIGHNNFDVSIGIDSNGEIGLMAKNFNIMVAELKKNKSKLNEYSNELQSSYEELVARTGALQDRDLESSTFSKMSEMLHACHSVEEAASVISGTLQVFFPNESGAIYIFNSSRNMLEAIMQWGQNQDISQIMTPSDCWGLRRGRPHLVVDLISDQRCQHAHDVVPPYICIPMVAQGETLGMLYLHIDTLTGVKDIKNWRNKKEHLALRVSENTGLAITNLKLRETLRNMSVRDPLTGLFNRRYMSEALELERQRCLRKESTIGILMIDIDHFKRFNDTFGHDAGDAVLKEIAAFLQQNIRGGDIACRYGGEEFTIIMPGATIETSALRANTLLDGVRHIHIKHKGQSVGNITLSIGVAIIPEHGNDSNTVMQAADTALYKAKHEGRDRICIACSL